MELSNIWTIILTTLGAFGGIATIVLGLSFWLGRVWADRILEEQRADNATQLEGIKQQLAIELEKTRQQFTVEHENRKLMLDLIKAKSQKYFETQHDICINLWAKLQDLKFIADELWKKASKDNISSFVEALRQSRLALEKAGIILSKEYYNRLHEILLVFENFELGKKRLIELRSENLFNTAYAMAEGYDNEDEEYRNRPLRIQRQIRENLQYKKKYDELLQDLRKELQSLISPSASENIAIKH